MTVDLADIKVLRGRSLVAWLSVLGLLYWVVAGGTLPGEVVPILQIANLALIGAVVAAFWASRIHRLDRLDAILVAALLLFLVSGLFSRSARLALLPSVAAFGYVTFTILLRRWAEDRVLVVRLALALGIAGVALSAVYAVVWLSIWWHWTSIGQPLSTSYDLSLPAGPYGWKHNIAVVGAVLIPFLWLVPRSGLLVVLRGVGILCLGAVLLLAGSRALWAGAVAGLVPLTTHYWPRISRVAGGARRLTVFAAVAIAALALIATLAGIAPALANRAGNVFTVSARGDLWSASLSEWGQQPLSGLGPGSWAAWLPSTGYFDNAAFSPRHPDSLMFQTLAETGLLGIVATLLVLAVVVASLIRRRSLPALWVAIFLATACLTANPFDHGFVIAASAAWLALVARRGADEPVQAKPTLRWLAATAGAGVLVASMTVPAASIFHGIAQQRLHSGDLAGAYAAMQSATAVDPDLALYHRESAVILYGMGRKADAIAEMRRTVQLNPEDDTGWAGLAIILAEKQQYDEAIDAAQSAVSAGATDPVNWQVMAAVGHAAGRPDLEGSAVRRALALSPWFTGVEAFRSSVPNGDLYPELMGALDLAASWPYTARLGTPVWLAGMVGDERAIEAGVAESGGLKDGLAGLGRLFECDPVGASEILADAQKTLAGQSWYWRYRFMLAAVVGRDDLENEAAYDLLGVPAAAPPPTISAFRPRADDQWRYRVVPLQVGAIGPRLPAAELGLDRWVRDPVKTAQRIAAETPLANCNVDR